jgi:sterol desaturase/sphingolipid hydroxylase (fatty acid hydroxylase superfamily)
MSGAVEVPSSQAAGRPGPAAGLGEHARFFFGLPMVRALYGTLAVLVAARLVVARWSVADAIVFGLLAASYPFIEWSIHVFILHFKPKRILGRTVELGAARNHADHHLDPENPNKNVADSGRNLAIYLGGWMVPASAIGLMTHSIGVFVTVLAYSMAILAMYEWFHYLMHSSYRPRGRVLAHMRRHHLMHHYRNEHYWFGVVSSFADRVLRTNPKPSAVGRSVTAGGPAPGGSH